MVKVDLDYLRRVLTGLPRIQAETLGWAIDELDQLRARETALEHAADEIAKLMVGNQPKRAKD